MTEDTRTETTPNIFVKICGLFFSISLYLILLSISIIFFLWMWANFSSISKYNRRVNGTIENLEDVNSFSTSRPQQSQKKIEISYIVDGIPYTYTTFITIHQYRQRQVQHMKNISLRYSSQSPDKAILASSYSPVKFGFLGFLFLLLGLFFLLVLKWTIDWTMKNPDVMCGIGLFNSFFNLIFSR